ncbi:MULTISPECIES: hypothetical protein [Halomicrobium]|uniref:Tetracyclin repressor-like C-terminal domain-containing protein n=1 Tax=Halomicrobium mukohataei TaxID=57705 RepID=A0A4D6KH76_9EURY|nr:MULTISPECIES: hypothetical protein [Halomicrobium]QCD65491.1 hypothetical protein E5139_07510 [Halomicrobium mukohataei]QFR20297.1 hypothetical protein GBQ70_07505 [Halomicrobium sp. ZPS1]
MLLEIYSREVESFTEQLRAELSEIGDDSEAIRLFFERYLAFFAENPYMDAARSIDDAFGLALETPERARAFERTLLEQQLPLIEQVQQHSDGPIAEMDPAIVFGFLRPLRSLHSDVQTSDRAYFEAVLDALVDVLVRGLTSNGPAEQVH